MFINNFDPVALNFFSLEIRWYSISYITGILIGWVLSKKFFISDNEIREKFDDFLTYLIFGVIFGGRLGYVIFYDINYYLNNFFDIFKIWQGGMSFHGGLLGVIIVSVIFAKRNNQNPFKYLDIVSLVAPIGIFFGRIANFINGELYGIPTEKSWGVIFPKIDNLARHPSQIYEALLEGLILLIVLNFFINKKKFDHGFISSLFLILYGAFRIISEQFREPDEHIGYILGNFTLGSILSIAMIIFGLIFASKIIFNEKNK